MFFLGLLTVLCRPTERKLYKEKMREESGVWLVGITAVRSRSLLECFVEPRNKSELAEALMSFP